MLTDLKRLISFLMRQKHLHQYISTSGKFNTIKFQEFDPIFRRSDFGDVRKRVVSKLEINRTIDRFLNKEVIAKKLRDRDNLRNTMIDYEQREFQRNRKPRKDNTGYSASAQPQNLDLDAVTVDQFEVKRQKRRQLDATFRKLTHSHEQGDRGRINLAQNVAIQQKFYAQRVLLQEKCFLRDLKRSLGDRYENLRRSFRDQYTIKGQDSLLDYSNDELHRSYITAQPAHLAWSAVRHSTNSGPHKIQNSTRRRIRECWDQSTEAQNYLEKLPVRSLCFDQLGNKTLQTATLKERIKINNGLTQRIRLKGSTTASQRPFSQQAETCTSPISTFSRHHPQQLLSSLRNEYTNTARMPSQVASKMETDIDNQAFAVLNLTARLNH